MSIKLKLPYRLVTLTLVCVVFILYHKMSGSSLKYHCPNTRRPNDTKYTVYGKWQITKRSKDSIIAYSAFYDDRPNIGELPVIQLMTVSTTIKDIFCHIWYDGIESPYVTRAQTKVSGAPYKFFGQTYGQYYFTCILPKVKPIPSHVTLAGSECGMSTIFLPIVHSPKSNWTVEFGICVSISYGDLSASHFIEWMEMSMILGVKEVHVYNGTVTDKIRNVFDSYIKENKLLLHDMPPAVESWTRTGAELGSPASLNDCMLRYMYRYRYILVVDFDEVIIPRKAMNYHNMIDDIHKEHNLQDDLPVYYFANTYFLFDFAPDKAESEHLPYLQYRKRAEPGAIGPGKSMVDPRRCLSVFNHHCYVPFPGMEHGQAYDVNSNVAITHHYKTCNLNTEHCNLLKSQKTKDDSILKFKLSLNENVEERKKLLE